KGIAEVIEYSTGLVSFAMQIIDNYEDKLIDRSSLRNLNIVLDAVRLNKNIKAIFISLVRGAEVIDLGVEVMDKILEIVAKSRNLMGLHLLKISLNKDFMKKLGNII